MPVSDPAAAFRIAPDFWSGKRVFVTGHTGFKGTWLVHWLHALGATCRGYARAPETDPAMFELTAAHEICDHIVGDVRDGEALARALTEFAPEIVLHLAAQPIVRYSYAAPIETFETNVMGTAHLLEACRAADSVRAVVVVSSDKCYANNEWEYGYRESDALGGKDPYSASKAGTEIVTQAWRASYFSEDSAIGRALPVASGRAGNVFGGGDYSQARLLPDAVRAATAGETLVVRAPDSVRPWQHCLESLGGYLRLARACHEGGMDYARGYNFGPATGQLLTVKDVVEAFTETWGAGAAWRHEPGEGHLKEAGLLLLEAGLAERSLGWRPGLGFDAAIAATVEWYSAAAGGADAASLRKLTLDQIGALAVV